METRKATIKYNQAEKQAKTDNGNQGFFARAKAIEQILTEKYGEDKADEILELVFEKEFS